MNKLINIQNRNGVLTANSREVAEHFEKEHKNVVRDIETIIGGMLKIEPTYENKAEGLQNCTHLFIESQYQHEQNKQWYKEYDLTRDGFTLLCMGFTGSKALDWKLKYINAFNEMEQTINQQFKPLSQAEIIAQMAQLNVELEKKVNYIDQKTDLTNSKLNNALDVFTEPVSHSWKDETNRKINQMCKEHGLNYRTFKGDLYTELEEKARCNISARQRNLRDRLKKGGATYKECVAISKIDVIERDDKLKLIFDGIVRKYQAKYTR